MYLLYFICPVMSIVAFSMAMSVIIKAFTKDYLNDGLKAADCV